MAKAQIDPVTRAVFKMARGLSFQVTRKEFKLSDFCRKAVQSALLDVQYGDLGDAVKTLTDVPPADHAEVSAAFVRCVDLATAEWNRPCPYTAPELQ